MIKICPKCKSLAHYNSYFQAFICSSPECRWMEKSEQQCKGKSLPKKINVKRYSEFATAK